ncbi:MAG: aldo/keto reductase [Candidatus Ancaeobacter aquaticus]|nr:aldo/keto reductase [Candidatus Ancaeobacter aquaticus]
MSQISRRDFVKKTSLGALGAGLLMSGVKHLMLPQKLFAKNKATEGRIEYRPFGKTGLNVTTISFGVMRTSEPNVIRKAVDMGINYYDTAHCYMGGNNEKILGKALKGVRDKVIIATKVHNDGNHSVESMTASIDASLKSLQTDYIDVMQLHNKTDAAGVLDSVAIEALEKCKKAGKIRFTGVTTHANETIVLDAAVKSAFYDMVLVSYNFMSPHNVAEAIARCHKAGLGVVAMKTQNGGYETKAIGNMTPHQASLRWVLDDKNVSNAIPSMISYEQLDEDFVVMGTMLGWSDRKILNKYAKSIEGTYCRRCGKCVASCKNNTDIPTLNRVLMYKEGYGDLRLARENYDLYNGAQHSAKCLTCSECVARCEYGIDIGKNMKKVQSLFA